MGDNMEIITLLRDLLAENGLHRHPIGISLEGGLVRLSGEVPRWEEAVLAGHLAGGLRGVRAVVNEIRAADPPLPPPPSPPPDETVIGRADVVIIGAGVVGAALARELSRYCLRVVLLEKESDVGCGASKANNGMVHSGIVQEPGSMKVRLNVRGNALFEGVCRELEVPFRRCGLMGLILKEEELFLLELIKARGEDGGIPVKIISREEALAMEPSLSPEIKGAFLAPTTAMTSPYKLTVAYAENAVANGATLFLDTAVVALRPIEGGVKVLTPAGSFLTRFCINAAGLYADRVAEMAGPPEFTLHPRKGELVIFDREFDPALHPAMATGVLALGQDPHTKGGGTMLTVDGNPEWGPTAVETADREDTAVSREGLARILQKFGPLLPGYPARDSIITHFAGLRAATYTEDFHIAFSRHLKGLLHVAGIQSPGLAAAPAIAEYVLDLLHQEGLALEQKERFEPLRRDPVHFRDLSPEEKRDCIGRDPRYGNLICRCEQVSETEVIAALHRPVPARTLDAVKRRTRAGMGRCQGSFCAPRVIAIMARELAVPPETITKDGPGSHLFTRRTKINPPPPRNWR